MPEGSSILAFLGSIKTAKETLTLILDSPKTLEKAELEYKIASLTKTLTELETQARDFEKIIQEKETKIENLENIINTKKKLSRKNGIYYETNDEGEQEAVCPKCWEVDKEIIHLISSNIGPYYSQFDCSTCLKCESKFAKLHG